MEKSKHIRRRVVFNNPINKTCELQVEDWTACFVQNNGNTDVILDRMFIVKPRETFNFMMLPENETYYQKLHIAFGDENMEDEDNPTTEGVKKLAVVAFIEKLK